MASGLQMNITENGLELDKGVLELPRNTYTELIQKQRDFFGSGQSRDLPYRRRQLERLEKMIDNHEKDILNALNVDLGKPIQEGYLTEVGFLKSEIRYLLKNLNRLARPAKVSTPLIYPGARSYIYQEPYGVVLIIAPWNYPLLLLLGPAVGAIAAGNCLVLKPSEFAPSTAELLCHLMERNFPEEYIGTVYGGAKETEQLLQHKFDYIFFTGGITVGKIIMQKAAVHLTPVTLELGGKSPCIVDRDIDIQRTARRIVWGKYVNAGQTCVAPDYLLVNRTIKNELLAEIKKAIVQLYGEEPDQSASYARIINDHHFWRLESFLNDGDLVAGGKRNRAQKYIAPTVIDNVSRDAAIMQDEIFGPLLPVLEYSDLKEAIDYINSAPRPLALYFFSRDRKKQERILQETSSGGVCINDTLIHISTGQLPFGGVGESGMGSYHGQATFATFSHSKSVMKNTFKLQATPHYPPYQLPLKWLKVFQKLSK